MSFATTTKRLGKRIIGYPEETVPVISSKDWLGRFVRNPKQPVRSIYLPHVSLYASMLHAQLFVLGH